MRSIGSGRRGLRATIASAGILVASGCSSSEPAGLATDPHFPFAPPGSSGSSSNVGATKPPPTAAVDSGTERSTLDASWAPVDSGEADTGHDTGTAASSSNDSGTLPAPPTAEDAGATTDGATTDGATSDDNLACAAPSDCSGATPICCGTATLTGGSLPNCTVGSVTTACQAACSDQLQLRCTATQTPRLCATSADCTSDTNGNTKCCTVANVPKPICISPLVSIFASNCN